LLSKEKKKSDHLKHHRREKNKIGTSARMLAASEFRLNNNNSIMSKYRIPTAQLPVILVNPLFIKMLFFLNWESSSRCQQIILISVF